MPRIDAVELAHGHDRVRGLGSGEHRYERDVKHRAARPQTHDRHVIGKRGRAELVNDRLYNGVRRDRPREGSHDAAETLRLGVAALGLHAGDARIHDGGAGERGQGHREQQVGDAAVLEVLIQTLPH